MYDLEKLGKASCLAKRTLEQLDTEKKNQVLLVAADQLLLHQDDILKANEKDLDIAIKSGMPGALQDRLRLTPQRIAQMAEGLRQLVALPDPIGEVITTMTRPNGLRIEQRRVPLGVVGIIYEARPNVTVDAFGLCLKTGNAVILRGGSDALFSNEAITEILRESCKLCQLPGDCVQLITDPSREVATAFMKLKEYVDVLIPRGGAGLIRSVVENATIPVIETGTGNCHIYVDEAADLKKAVSIIKNAKTQRIGVCNACESLVVHEKILKQFMEALHFGLEPYAVELRCDEKSLGVTSYPYQKQADDADWGTEYLDYILSVKTVSSLTEAIEHINRYNTGHSEAIITEDTVAAQRFLKEIDAAAVYVNASTRFTDGFEFGFGAEIGISTQKLHARGPMGLLALTSSKYVIYGNGQVRE